MEIGVLLSSETALNLCTLHQVKLTLEIPLTATADAMRDQRLRALIARLSREAMIDPEYGMLRATVRKARTLEIHDTRSGQHEFRLLAAPIVTTTAPVVRHNQDDPRVWTDEDDIVDSEDVLCTGKRAEAGIVYVRKAFGSEVDSVAFDYTGGLATWTGWVSWDGSTASGGTTLTSASGDFIAAGIAAGFKLVIESGACAGTYTVSTVGKTTLVISGATFPATESSLPFHVTDADGHSLIQDYPDLADAIANQAANDYRMRGKDNFTAESAGGKSVTWSIPANWLNRTKDTLARYRTRAA